MLAALVFDPNLPALRAVELTVSQDGVWYSKSRPLMDGLRREVEQRAGADVGEWRVEVVEAPPDDDPYGLRNQFEIRASRLF